MKTRVTSHAVTHLNYGVIMDQQELSPELKKANLRVALILGGLAISSLCVAAWGVSKTLGYGA